MDKLQFIIQSFSKEEASGFENFVNRFRVRNNRLDLQLFQRMQKPEKLPLEEAYQILYNGAQEKEAYHALRKRLLGHLIDFIAVKKINDQKGNKHYDGQGMIELTKYLFNQGAYEPGWQYFNRALASEEKKGNHEVLSELYMLWLENWSGYEGNANFNDIYNKYLFSKEQTNLNDRLKLAFSVINRKIEQYKTQLNDINIESITKEVIKDLNLSKKDFYTPEHLLYITKIFRSNAQENKDYQGIAVFLKSRIKKLEKKEPDYTNPALTELLYLYAHALYRTKQFDAALKEVQRVDWLNSTGTKKQIETGSAKVKMLHWACLFYGGNIDKTSPILELADQEPGFNDAELLLDLKLNKILDALGQENLTKASNILNSINHSPQWLQKKKGLEWRIKFQLIETILLLEKGMIDLVLNKLQSLKKIVYPLARRNSNFNNIKVYLQLLEKGLNTPEGKLDLSALDQFEFTEIEKENTQAMPFYAYLKAKATNQDFYQTLITISSTN